MRPSPLVTSNPATVGTALVSTQSRAGTVKHIPSRYNPQRLRCPRAGKNVPVHAISHTLQVCQHRYSLFWMRGLPPRSNPRHPLPVRRRPGQHHAQLASKVILRGRGKRDQRDVPCSDDARSSHLASPRSERARRTGDPDPRQSGLHLQEREICVFAVATPGSVLDTIPRG